MQAVSSKVASRSSRGQTPATFEKAISQSPLSRWLEVLRCPECGGRIHFSSPDGRELLCRKCAATFSLRHGIPNLIHRERLPAIEKFSKAYEAMRLTEGWANTQPGYYEALPFADISGAHAKEWKWRAQSFLRLQRWLRRTFKNAHAGLRILDAGAGSGWMSRELAKHHNVIALDSDAGDHGLNAMPIEQRRYLAVQGELATLPFADGSFHLVVASASAHHASNFQNFLREAARVLRLDCWLVIMDSPTYPSEAAQRAARDRSRAYFEKLGFPQMTEFYAGIVDSDYQQQSYFNFVRHRSDFSRTDYALKRLREIAGQASGARFPFWIGKRRTGTDELAPRGRYRAGIIIRHKDEILMTIARHHSVEFWHTPGGTMQPGEAPQQAAQRRILSECNLDLEIEGGLGEYLFPAHREWCFIAKPLDDSARKQCQEFLRKKTHAPATLQWLSIDRLGDFDIRPSALKMDLIAFLKNRG